MEDKEGKTISNSMDPDPEEDNKCTRVNKKEKESQQEKKKTSFLVTSILYVGSFCIVCFCPPTITFCFVCLINFPIIVKIIFSKDTQERKRMLNKQVRDFFRGCFIGFVFIPIIFSWDTMFYEPCCSLKVSLIKG